MDAMIKVRNGHENAKPHGPFPAKVEGMGRGVGWNDTTAAASAAAQILKTPTSLLSSRAILSISSALFLMSSLLLEISVEALLT